VLGRKCKSLLHLHIEHIDTLSSFCMTDDQAGQFASILPQLQYLCIEFGHGLSVKAWELVEKHCRDLRNLTIVGVFPMSLVLWDHDNIDCLYPQLKVLETHMTDYILDAMNELADRLGRHTSRIEIFYFTMDELHKVCYDMHRGTLEVADAVM